MTCIRASSGDSPLRSGRRSARTRLMRSSSAFAAWISSRLAGRRSSPAPAASEAFAGLFDCESSSRGVMSAPEACRRPMFMYLLGIQVETGLACFLERAELDHLDIGLAD